MDTYPEPEGLFDYYGKFRPVAVQEEMVEPIAYWWRTADGPGAYFAKHRHVSLTLSPGDMTAYEMYLGIRPGRWGGMIVALTNWGTAAVINEGNLGDIGQISHYLAGKLALDEKYDPAKILVSTVAKLGYESLASAALTGS